MGALACTSTILLLAQHSIAHALHSEGGRWRGKLFIRGHGIHHNADTILCKHIVSRVILHCYLQGSNSRKLTFQRNSLFS